MCGGCADVWVRVCVGGRCMVFWGRGVCGGVVLWIGKCLGV